jgi:hypothetical protein
MEADKQDSFLVALEFDAASSGSLPRTTVVGASPSILSRAR